MEGQYIKTMASRKHNQKGKKGSNIFWMQSIFIVLPFCLQNNNKREGVGGREGGIYSAYIYIKAFLLGRTAAVLTTPTSTQSNK